MSIERRLERLERDYPPYTPRQIQLVDVCGPAGTITMIIVGGAEPAPEGDAA